jgi:predicted nucleic acid-binding protein
MSDVVVVDASVAVKWVLAEPDSLIATKLLDAWTNGGKRVIAPALFAYEVTNIIHRRVVTNRLTYDEGVQALTDLLSTGVVLHFSKYEEISLRSIKLAHLFSMPASYDAHYLALAEQQNCEYWTADTRLWNTVRGKLSWIHWLGDYHS